MKVTIELRYGPQKSEYVSRADMQRTIDALDRAVAKASMADSILLMDAKSIFVALQLQIPEPRTRKPGPCPKWRWDGHPGSNCVCGYPVSEHP